MSCESAKPKGVHEPTEQALTSLRGLNGDLHQMATDLRCELEARQRSDSLFRAVTENSHTMMVLADSQGIIRFATSAAFPLLQYTQSETIGKTAADFVVSEDIPKVIDALRRCIETPFARANVEARLRCKDGGVKVVQLAGSNLLAEPSVGSVVVTMHDITELRENEARVRESELRLRTVLDSLHALVGLLSVDGRIWLINRTALDMIGSDMESLRGKSFADAPWWTHPESRARLLTTMADARAGRTSRFDAIHVTPSGERRTVDFVLTPVQDASGKVAYLVPASVDITDRVRAAEALRAKELEFLQAQKMEAVGRLAGGVAHDFNNIITAVMAFSDILLTDLPRDSDSIADVQEIRRAAERAHGLTKQLLAFSRSQVMEPQAFELCERLRGMMGMLKRLVGEDIMLSISCDNGRGQVFADPGQIEQVVLNLVVNARDAMAHGGTLDIGVQQVRRASDGTGDDARWIRLTVRDTGCGIEPGVVERIFEPFFTTKEASQGTGLGLSTVYGIVKQTGGFLEVESEVGGGTTFIIHLPLWTGQEAPPATEVARETRLPARHLTVLLVEDDDVVRAVAKRVLERAGFTVIEAADGLEGVEQATAHADILDLVITDIVMPRMSGIEMLEQLQTLGITPAVLVTSGYTEDTLARHGNVPAAARYLDKPFTGDALVDAARAALRMRGAAREGETVAAT